MPTISTLQNINVPDAGATVQLTSTTVVDRYLVVITQTGTLSGNVSISDDALSTNGAIYTVEYPGGVTIGGNTVTIFGKSLTAQQALTPCLIIARWNGSAFITQIYTDWSSSNNVTTAQILANAVTTAKILDSNVTWAKLQALARGSTLRGSSTNVVEALALASGRFPLGDGTDVTAGVMSGDATLAGTGALTIANNAITTAKILDEAVTLGKMADLARGNMIVGDNTDRPAALDVAAAGAGAIVMTDGADIVAQLMSGDGILDGAGELIINPTNEVLVATLSISSAQILAGNTTPLVVVDPPGAGKAIQVIAAAQKFTYVAATYAVNVTGQLITDTAVTTQATASIALAASRNTRFALTGSGVNQTLVANKALMWSVATGDPTTGDGTINLVVAYQIIDL